MSRRLALITVLGIVFVSMLGMAFKVHGVEAPYPTEIYVRANGSIDPPTANITSLDNVTYYLIDNNYAFVKILKDNIVFDGAGYTLQGRGSRAGIELTGRNNVTIKNVEIRKFDHGIKLKDSSNNLIIGNHLEGHFYDGIRLINSTKNIISGNDITDNKSGTSVVHSIGVGLSGSSDNNITRNHITGNDVGIGLYAYWALGSTGNSVSGNNVTANNVYGIRLSNSFDNIIFGNHIANSEHGISVHNSGGNIISGNNITNNLYGIHVTKKDYGYRIIGENAIHQNNFANNTYQIYPLPSPLWMQWWFWAIVTIGIIAIVATVYFLKRRKPTRPKLGKRRLIRCLQVTQNPCNVMSSKANNIVYGKELGTHLTHLLVLLPCKNALREE